MDTEQIRRKWVDFFQKRGHKLIPSSSLVPHGDPTLLFTSAGMVQFKPYFMGQAEPPAPRMVSIQKCFRTSDIDSVGDATHLTFFEMLGNFSVGDYFKKEAIEWAWELVTDPKEGIGLDPDKLWISVYLDDDEAAGHWRALGVPEDRIMRYGEEDNYWFSGDVGPCGPCSEIHYDYGLTDGCPECAKGACHPQIDCGRFTEIWNLVFTMYYQNEDGSRSDLPQKNIDTGAGLERWASVLQGKRTVYETDLFRPIIAKVAELSQIEYGKHLPTEHPVTTASAEQQYRAMRIVAEHARAAAFLIAGGVMPSNEGRGYVLRRLIRRATYFSRWGVSRELSEVAKTVAQCMGGIYPELREQESLIIRVLDNEERRFSEATRRGGIELDARLSSLFGAGRSIVPGDVVFLLYDTYGFPMELTREIARHHGSGFTIDEAGFQREMEEQRERARAAARFRLTDAESAEAYADLSHIQTRFVGYDTRCHETTIAGIIAGGQTVESAEEGDEAEVVLFETPFYAESGGQVGDIGEISGPAGRFQVRDTQRTEGGLILHRGRVVEGRISVNDDVVAQVDAEKCRDTARNHTATHLLHAALRRVLGPHARQAGSLVSPERLRFDFTHIEALKPDELAAVQRLVNEKVRENLPVRTWRTSYEEATAGGAMALFDEKYAAEVRVVEVPEEEEDERYSAELCGGTHVQSTGEIGSLVIVSEESVGAGMRRIEAVTGRGAEEYVREHLAALDRLGARLSVSGGPAELEQRVDSLLGEMESLNKRVRDLERELGRQTAESLLKDVENVDGSAVLAARVPATSAETLREMGDWLRDHLKSAVVVLGTVVGGRPSFLAMVTPDLTARGLHAGDLVKKVAQVTGGGGGGRPEMAQAGGVEAARLDDALRLARKLSMEGIKALRGS